MEVSGERATEPPTVWIKLEIVYRLRGKLDDKAVRDAIQLSEDKYCSVAATLRKTAPITFRYEISPKFSRVPRSQRRDHVFGSFHRKFLQFPGVKSASHIHDH